MSHHLSVHDSNALLTTIHSSVTALTNPEALAINPLLNSDVEEASATEFEKERLRLLSNSLSAQTTTLALLQAAKQLQQRVDANKISNELQYLDKPTQDAANLLKQKQRNQRLRNELLDNINHHCEQLQSAIFQQ